MNYKLLVNHKHDNQSRDKRGTKMKYCIGNSIERKALPTNLLEKALIELDTNKRENRLKIYLLYKSENLYPTYFGSFKELIENTCDDKKCDAMYEELDAAMLEIELGGVSKIGSYHTSYLNQLREIEPELRGTVFELAEFNLKHNVSDIPTTSELDTLFRIVDSFYWRIISKNSNGLVKNLSGFILDQD